jgi:DNA (cytosine-5)-methyltransferase 1
MKHLDLFSGIGGFAYAIDQVCECEHIFCDNDKFCQAVLKKHWPKSKIYGDIRTIIADTKHNGIARTENAGEDSGTQPESKTGAKLSVTESSGVGELRTEKVGWDTADIITGGFPCQPFSQAGKRRGTEDNRYLWPEMFRVIRDFQPTFVIAENVRGLVTWNEGMVLEQVCLDLESEGYEVQPIIIPAVAVNAPHRRDRVWIIACHPDRVGRFRRNQEINPAERGEQTLDQPEGRHSDASNPRQQCGVEGNEQGVETNSSKRSSRSTDTERQSENVADLPIKGRTGSGGEDAGRHRQPDRNGSDQRRDWDKNWIEVATKLCSVDDGIPAELGDFTCTKAQHRTHQLKAYGNAIVPQVALEIIKTLIKNYE